MPENNSDNQINADINSTLNNNSNSSQKIDAININLNQQSLSKVIDNAVQSAIKEYKRWKLRRLIMMFLFFVFIVFIIFSSINNNDGVISNSNVSTEHTAIISIDGEISASSTANADLIIHSLRNAFKNEYSKAIILKINSPGGSPVQSGIIYDEIKRLRSIYPKKLVYAVAGDICASGAYYIASAADYIYADKASMVGSIGVLMDGFGFNKTMQQFGVERRLYTAGKNKGMLDPFSPENPEQKGHIQNMLNTIHQQFINSVRNGRGNRLKINDDTFSGLVWSGDNAVKNGLIDGLATADIVARNIIKQEELVDYTVQEGFAGKLAKQFGASFGHSIANKINFTLN